MRKYEIMFIVRPDLEENAVKETVKKLESVAKNNNIAYQFKRTTAGGNDSGAIHKSREGVKTVCISIPARG